MAIRIPNPSSPTEVRQAFQHLEAQSSVITGGTSGYLLVAQGEGVAPVWQTIVSTIDHGEIGGLGDDDHTIYLLADGTRALAGNWSLGSNDLTSVGLFGGVDIPEVNQFFNGTFQETFDALVTSDGSIITMSLEQSGTGDLTMQFSDGYTTLDCTDPLQTIALTAGVDDTSPQGNYIYVLKSTKALTKSTSSWPAEEHIRVAYFLVPSAVFVASNGCYVNQNCNDHLMGTDLQGHMSHMTAKLRRLGATWYSGVNPNGATASYFTIGVNTVNWLSTQGKIDQLHEHTYPAVETSGSDVVLVVNQNGTAYDKITDLYSIVNDSTGDPIGNNKYFNLVFWGVVNKSGEFAALMVNLPGGFYTRESDALIDADGYDVYDIPREFSIDSGTAFLICRATFKKGGTWTHVSTTDLRGLTPATASGSSVNDHGGLGGLTDVADHLGYLLVDGSRSLAGNMSVDAGITIDGVDLSVAGYTAGTGLTGGGDLTAARTIAFSHLGIEDLVDPNIDRLLIWDDSESAVGWLEIGTGLQSGTGDGTSTFGSLGSDVGKWSGAVLAANGFIYCIPHNATTILKIDPVNGTTSTFGSLAGSTKWAGGVFVPATGMIYGIPFDSTTILKIDTSDDSVTTFGSLAGSAKWVGGALADNGYIYCAPFDSTTVLKIKVSDDSVSTFGAFGVGGDKWNRCIFSVSGYVYCVPFTETYMLRIDPNDDSTTTVGSFGGDAGKWAGCCEDASGFIYCTPFGSATVLKIDTSDDSTSTFGSLGAVAEKYEGSVFIESTGMVYSIPHDLTTVLKIDTSDDSISTFGSLAGADKWAGTIFASGKIFGVPFTSATVLEISFDAGLSTDPSEIDHDALLNTHNLTTDIDHDTITNAHNLTTDIDHDTITNAHNLTTDIDHDQTTNYDANKHIDHTGVSIATAATSGISGGGTIASTRNLALNINGLTGESAIVGGDTLPFYDDTAGANRKITLTELSTALGASDEKVKIDAAATAGYIGAANSDGVLRTGSGIAYADGGDYVTLALDINSLSVATIVDGDFVPFWDITATATNKKITFSNFEAALTKGFPTTACSVHLSGAQTIAHNTATVVEWDTELLDPGGNFDTGTHRYTAPSTGYYLIELNARMEITSGTWMGCWTRKGAPVADRFSFTFGYATDSSTTVKAASGIIVYLTASEYVETTIQHFGGVNKDINPAKEYSNLSIIRVA